MYLDGTKENPENKKFEANIDHIQIKKNENFILGKEDGIKIPLNITFQNGDYSGRALIVLGGRGNERLDVNTPIRKYREGEGYIYQNMNTENPRDQKIIEFMYKLKEKIYDTLKANPDILERESLDDDDLDKIVQMPLLPNDTSGLRVKIKVRMRANNGNYTPVVFHKKDKKHHYESLEKINEAFDPNPSEPTKRYKTKMTLFCQLENIYFNYKKDMQSGEYVLDDEGNEMPMLYPVISLYQAVVGDPEEVQGLGLVTKQFELDEFPVENVSIDEPITDQNDIKRSYVNLKDGDQTARWQVWIRDVPNIFGLSTSQKNG